LKSYIVRIYRCQEKIPRSLVGVVEEVGAKGKKAFTNLDELWEIMSSIKSKKKGEKPRCPLKK
jgi:hypothetical protein